MRRNCWTVALCLGLLLLGGLSLQADDPERQQWAELKAKMEAEGWREIASGVFERQRGVNKVEHLGFGRKGLAWHIGKLTRQLEDMMREYDSYPSEDLAKAIDNLSVVIARGKTELRNMPEGLSNATATLAGGSCTDLCYSATADAYYRTDVQGVAAIADAKFNSTCGYSGDTYAYAYAQATKNGTTTTLTQEDPHTGTSVTSHAVASVAGGSVSGVPCYSTANSYAQSYTLGISYSTSDTNNLCPVPLSVAITSGPTNVPFTTATCATQTWTAAASGGVSSYTYKWYVNNGEVGSGPSYPRSVCYNHADFTLKVVATDSTGATANATRTIDVSYTPPAPPSVTINGTTVEDFYNNVCRTETWTSTVANLSAPYTYRWTYNGSVVGTDSSSYTRSVCASHSSFTLGLTVTGSNGSVSDTHYVEVNYEPITGCSVTAAGQTVCP